VIHTTAFNVDSLALSSDARTFSTAADDSGSRADVGSAYEDKLYSGWGIVERTV
jgi:hypothetical protein